MLQTSPFGYGKLSWRIFSQNLFDMTLIDICDKCRNHTHEGRIEYYTSDRQQRLRSWVKLLILQKSSAWSPNTLRGSELTIIPSWKKFSENFLKFTEIYLNHIWKIAYYHFVPLNQFWTHFSNIAELSEKSELFWICLKNLNCFENCWNSLNSICIVLKQSELFWILLKQSELF